jgi:SAM-dependent methyltransferase
MADVSFEGFPPIPPPELIQRVVLDFSADDAERTQRHFHADAETGLLVVQRALAGLGREIGDFDRLLDFGCGPGRVLRWFVPYAEQVELHGTDIDADAIEWCKENLGYASFTTAPHEPPTEYPDGYFDLVINHSVFTHLDEHYQDLWLAELQRITRPGGVLLLTVCSARQVHVTLEGLAGAGVDAEAYRARLERDGILFIENDAFVGSSHPPFYHSTLHAPWYVLEHWSRFFDVRGYLPEGGHTLDMVVLIRREDGAEVLPPIGRRPAAVPAAPAAPASDPELDRALARLNELYRGWPPARTALGRLKRRVLRGEIDRSERMHEALVALAQLLAERPERADGLAELKRDVHLLHVAVETQGARISLLARELRERDA